MGPKAIIFSKEKRNAPNNACNGQGVRTAFFAFFLALSFSRFESESALPPQAGNADRWAAPS